MRTLPLMSALILPLTLAACSSPNCPEPEPFAETTFEVSEQLLLDLEAAFDLERSELPCEAVCEFVYEDQGAGEALEVSACELTLDESSEDPQAIVAEVECEGETYYSCE